LLHTVNPIVLVQLYLHTYEGFHLADFKFEILNQFFHLMVTQLNVHLDLVDNAFSPLGELQGRNGFIQIVTQRANSADEASRAVTSKALLQEKRELGVSVRDVFLVSGR
jgi:hypothetical protein